MINITLPTYIGMAILIVVILIPVSLWADKFADRVERLPAKKTWRDVVIGVGVSQSAVVLMQLGIFWLAGVIDLTWWVPFLSSILVYGITGGLQIHHQEKKLRRGRRKSDEIATMDDKVKWDE